MKIEGSNFNAPKIGEMLQHSSKKNVGSNEKQAKSNTKLSKELPAALQVQYANVFKQLEGLQNSFSKSSSAETRSEINKLLSQLDNIIGGAGDVSRENVEKVGNSIKNSAASIVSNLNINPVKIK